MNTLETQNIRHYLDSNSGVLYLSIVDVIEMLGLSTDSRNYWKTLKSRLKTSQNKAQNKLVTACNQLKMKASDGKMYLTDATDSYTMLEIIQHIAPSKVGQFRVFFKKIEAESYPLSNNSDTIPNELSTADGDEYELGIDAFTHEDFFTVRAMLAGVEKDDISIVANCKNILIKGERNSPRNISEEDYAIHELAWGKFSREINLPEEINIDEIETNFSYGLLEIKLPKIDKTRTKIIKVK